MCSRCCVCVNVLALRTHSGKLFHVKARIQQWVMSLYVKLHFFCAFVTPPFSPIRSFVNPSVIDRMCIVPHSLPRFMGTIHSVDFLTRRLCLFFFILLFRLIMIRLGFYVTVCACVLLNGECACCQYTKSSYAPVRHKRFHYKICSHFSHHWTETHYAHTSERRQINELLDSDDDANGNQNGHIT